MRILRTKTVSADVWAEHKAICRLIGQSEKIDVFSRNGEGEVVVFFPIDENTFKAVLMEVEWENPKDGSMYEPSKEEVYKMISVARLVI